MTVPATVVDAAFTETTALATRQDAPAVSWTPSFAVAVDDAIARKAEKRRFFSEVMDPDLHYGVIPGTGTKPTLLKPGAEMLLSNMGLNATFIDAEPPVVDVLGKDHGGEAYIRYRRICRIYRQLGAGENERMIVAEAGGSCSSWETKYRYRSSGAACPTCNKPLRMSKDKPEWYCWAKKGGCGATYPKAQFSFEQVPNPDVAELENTILKMADKRALVAATLIATGCSDIFTQDVEDVHGDAGAGDPPERTERPAAASQSHETLLGASKERTEALSVVARGWAALGLTADAEYAQRVAQVGDPNTAWDKLTLLELQRLGRVLAREYRERGVKPEPPPVPVVCPECRGGDGEHIYDDLGPCLLDNSDRAIRIRAGEASYDRNPELHQESLL